MKLGLENSSTFSVVNVSTHDTARCRCWSSGSFVGAVTRTVLPKAFRVSDGVRLLQVALTWIHCLGGIICD